MTVEGRVVSVKTVESARGSYCGMAVRLRNGVTVWSTVPSALYEAAWPKPESLRGKRIRFKATFEPSGPRFAFARRPRAAELT